MSDAIRPVLVWDRIQQNRRDTLLLLVAFVLIMLPAAVYVNEFLTAYYSFGRVMSGSVGADPDRAGNLPDALSGRVFETTDQALRELSAEADEATASRPAADSDQSG